MGNQDIEIMGNITTLDLDCQPRFSTWIENQLWCLDLGPLIQN